LNSAGPRLGGARRVGATADAEGKSAKARYLARRPAGPRPHGPRRAI